MKEIHALTADCLDQNGWFDLARALKESLRNIPRSIREPDDGMTHCNTIVAMTGDTACDPRSGGVVGVKNMAAVLGVEEQQFRRNILPNLLWMRWLANKPATNVASLEAFAVKYAEMKSKILSNNSKQRTRLKREDITRVNAGHCYG